MNETIQSVEKGPRGTWYSTKEIKEVWDFFDEEFGHYECYDPRLPLVDNVRRVIGYNIAQALEEEKLRLININAGFYEKEVFQIGDLKIETRR